MTKEKKGRPAAWEASASRATRRSRSSSATPQVLENVTSSAAKSVRSTIWKPLPPKKAFMLSKNPKPP